MRVVAGQWRGRRLQSPKGDLVRPTTDRVKEAMFSILGPAVPGAVVLDLCCGAGGLAIEALSRGAERAILVDIHRKSLDLARRNLEICGANPDCYELVRDEAETFFNDWAPPAAGTPWILLCDPPYHLGLAQAIVQRLTWSDPDEAFRAGIIEHGNPSDVDEIEEGPWRLKNRQYGETVLSVVRPA